MTVNREYKDSVFSLYLSEYSRFIGKIKENLNDGLYLEESIHQAIEYGIEHDIMREFLETNGSEVANMLLSGWNMDEALSVSKEEGYEDGYDDGKAEGKTEERKELIRKFSKKLSPEDIAETLSVSKAYVLDVLQTEGYVCEPGAKYEVNKQE